MKFIGIKCDECGFIATENEPMELYTELDVDTNKEEVSLVCPKCHTGTIIDTKEVKE